MKSLKFNKNRITTHVASVILGVIGCGLIFLYMPTATVSEILSLGTGYVALLLLALTLLIGPFNLLRKRRNPVNINLRRDVGIWSGIWGLLHVVFSLQLYFDGDILSYFLTKTPRGYSLPNFDLSSVSNYTGLIATFILLVLLVTSNQVSLIWLKGKSWKNIQRFNYLMCGLVLVHTFGYQFLNVREGFFIVAVVAVSVVTVVAQLGGVVLSLQRKQARQQANLPNPYTVASPAQLGMARRRFIMVSGAAILGSFATGFTVGKVFDATRSATAAPAVAQAPTNSISPSLPTPTSGSSNPVQPTPPARNGADNRRPQPGGFGNNPGATPSTTATPVPGGSGQPSNNQAGSIILATTASLGAGKAIKFTTPDTNQVAFLVRHQDGTIKAFSGICTHRPYDLVYDNSHATLFCDLHNVAFNTVDGAPANRPARTALPAFKVTTDSQGNIRYIGA